MGTGGGSGSPSGSPPDGGGSPGDRALLERMPSRPRAKRASPMGPPLNLAAAVDAASKGSGGAGEVLLGPKDCDVARSSNASSMSGFQPYRSGSDTLKHSMSGSRLDGERDLMCKQRNVAMFGSCILCRTCMHVAHTCWPSVHCLMAGGLLCSATKEAAASSHA